MSEPKNELEEVLECVVPRIVKYVKDAETNQIGVAKLQDPSDLMKSLKDLSGPSLTTGRGLEGLEKSMEWLLQNSVCTWHSAFLEKLYAGTNPVGVASDLLLSVLNTNSHVFTASPAFTLMEKLVAKMYANQFGFEGPRAGGLTFPGGSYSNMTAMQTARSTLFPETKTGGQAAAGKIAVFTSEHSHYSLVKSAIMLGIGHDAVFKVAVDEGGRMKTEDLSKTVEEAVAKGYKPFFVNATAGSTVYGSYDPIAEIADVAAKHGMWLHVDGSFGGNVVFSKKLSASRLTGAEKANSITANPHKMLGVPCTCSFLLVPDTAVFQSANSLAAGYLFHARDDDNEEADNFDLADGTMGCGRRPDAAKMYLAWQYYGTEGFTKRIEHAFAMSAYLADIVSKTDNLKLISENPPPCLQCCFWYSPKGASKEDRSRYTQQIVRELHRQQRFLVDFAPHPEGDFFRVVLNAPSVDEKLVTDLVNSIVVEGNRLSQN